MNHFLPEEIAAIEKGIAWLVEYPARWVRGAAAYSAMQRRDEAVTCACIMNAADRFGGLPRYDTPQESTAAYARRCAVVRANDSAPSLPAAIAAVRRLVVEGVPA